MSAVDGVETVDELLQWTTTHRQWKDALRKKTSQGNLFRLARLVGSSTKEKLKAALAEGIIRAIEHLQRGHEPSAKMRKTVEVPNPATPEPTRQTSRSRTPRRNGGNMAGEQVATPARSPHAAEALAMSTRKTTNAAETQVTSPDLKRPFSRHSTLSADDVEPLVLAEVAGARAHIKELAEALKELQGNALCAVWPKKTGVQSGLYYKLRAARRQYKETPSLCSH